MDENKNDGHLLFLMGRCCEDGKNDVDAVSGTERRSSTRARANRSIPAARDFAPWPARTSLTMPIKPSKRWSSPPPRIISCTWSAAAIVAQFACRRAGPTFKGAGVAEASPDVYLEMAKTVETSRVRRGATNPRGRPEKSTSVGGDLRGLGATLNGAPATPTRRSKSSSAA